MPRKKDDITFDSDSLTEHARCDREDSDPWGVVRPLTGDRGMSVQLDVPVESTPFTSYSAAALARREYRSLALQYFGGKNQRKNLVRIPLETVQQGFDWLNRQPGVKKGSIAVVGFSRGAEAALCFGEMNSKAGLLRHALCHPLLDCQLPSKERRVFFWFGLDI